MQGGAGPRQGKRRGGKGGKGGSKAGKKKKRRGVRGPSQGQVQRMGPPRRKPKGYCECPACGTKVAVYTEVPCYIMNCSKCGCTMKRSGGNKSPQEILPQ